LNEKENFKPKINISWSGFEIPTLKSIEFQIRLKKQMKN